MCCWLPTYFHPGPTPAVGSWPKLVSGSIGTWNLTCPNWASDFLPQPYSSPPTVPPILVKGNFIFLVAQAKACRTTLDLTLYTTHLMHLHFVGSIFKIFPGSVLTTMSLTFLSQPPSSHLYYNSYLTLLLLIFNLYLQNCFEFKQAISWQHMKSA